MRLEDKVVVITGGGTGIGRGTAILFAKEGAKVMIAGRREETLRETVEIIRSNNGSADYVVTDISKSEQVKRLFETTADKYGKIDILFNNAAIFTGNGNDISELKEEDWDTLMDINLKASKRIGKYLNLAFYVNRLLGIYPDYTLRGVLQRRTSESPYFGMEMNLTF